jgi:UrcA family protein
MYRRLFPRLMTLVAAVTTLAVALIAALAITSTDRAPEGRVSVRIPYADLAVDKEPGAKILLARIETAKARFCRGEGEVRILDGRTVAVECAGSRPSHDEERSTSPLLGAATNISSSSVVVGDR